MLKTFFLLDKEIKVPDYMAILPSEAINRLLDEKFDHCIVSCGIDPETSCLRFITLAAEVREISPNSRTVPLSAFPSHDGKRIGISFDGIEGLFAIDSKLAYEKSQPSLHGIAKISIGDNYLADIGLDQLVDVSQNDNEDYPERATTSNL